MSEIDSNMIVTAIIGIVLCELILYTLQQMKI